MAKTWMEASGQNGIPTAFIVNKEGKIAWIGHPMEMERPLEKIIAGTWDLKTAAEAIPEAAAYNQGGTESLARLAKNYKDREARRRSREDDHRHRCVTRA